MNHMEDVAKMLGVELEEEFNISHLGVVQCIGGEPVVYKFTQNKLVAVNFDSIIDDVLGTFLQRLINGEFEIIYVAYKPKMGGVYYSYSCPSFCIMSSTWDEDAIDYARQAAGMVFRTAEEAEKARPAIYEKLTGKGWCEDND